MFDPSFQDRKLASLIIQLSRRNHKRGEVAHMINIKPIYVTITEYMTRRRDNSDYYMTPKHIIKIILDWGKSNVVR